ncbi:MAG TPA: TetR/AcrR family transcriptional regulator C-terminal domain-containing protein [Actinomycetota bacterium]|nr:TetR/AcrR family transcriptional regulator C-terminal domain-containing protein [Actinomycetota bacterium]
MATKIEREAQRVPLSTERIVDAAVELADRGGLDSLSMRRIAEELDVVPMALYRHVANKDELLDAMVDAVVLEIDPVEADVDWKAAMRGRILSARRMLQRHPWAARVIESRTDPTPAVIGYIDEMIGLFLAGGFTIELTHHALHAMGSRILGFTQELFEDTPDVDPEVEAAMLEAMSQAYPNIGRMIAIAVGSHDDSSRVGDQGCDDQFEFEFALDLMLDGLERVRDRG